MESTNGAALQHDLLGTLITLLKKVLLIALGSGLLSNALFIYGLAYYQGYIEAFGFEYQLFPTDWSDALLWTYVASRELGISTVKLWTDMGGKGLLLIAFSFYMLARIWMLSTGSKAEHKPLKRIPHRGLAKLLVIVRRRYPRTFLVIFPPLRWFFNTEQSLWAFVASYFAMIVVFFIPVFLMIWVYFPMIGNNHGASVTEKWITRFEQSLCGESGDTWSRCIQVSTNHIKQHSVPTTLCGRLIAKKGDLLALYTKDGPVTVTQPSPYYYRNEKLDVDSEFDYEPVEDCSNESSDIEWVE